jgi:acetylornithine deacetylase
VDPVIRVLSDLVAIPSVNPMGRDNPGPECFEGRLTDYLEAAFRRLRVDFHRDTVSPGRDNILARFTPAGRVPARLLWDVHQDTVPVEGMTVEPFTPHIAGGRLFGRGACDVKGSMAAMLVAFERLVAQRPPGAAEVTLACTVDEEYTHTGSSRLATQVQGIDLAIVAEPTRLDLVTAHKGAVRWKLRTSGVACHSSTPQLGDNAIYRMARVVSALETHAAHLAARPPHPMLGPPSLSVGRITGGQSVNIVPDSCEIEIDRRLLPGEDPETVPADIDRELHAALGSLAGISRFPSWVRMPALIPRVSESHLDLLAHVITSATGRTPRRSGVPYGTDAGPLSQAGTPCVVLGPGDIAQAHTKDEWIDLAELRQAVDVYHNLAIALGSA